MKEPNREAGRWLRQAEYDLRSARHSSEGDFHAAACFQAQQAVEKALKAYLYAQGERLVLGHSVAELSARCARVDERFSALAEGCWRVATFPLAIPMGYPAASRLKPTWQRMLTEPFPLQNRPLPLSHNVCTSWRNNE
jgi:HEPN domain-containing protein